MVFIYVYLYIVVVNCDLAVDRQYMAAQLDKNNICEPPKEGLNPLP